MDIELFEMSGDSAFYESSDHSFERSMESVTSIDSGCSEKNIKTKDAISNIRLQWLRRDINADNPFNNNFGNVNLQDVAFYEFVRNRHQDISDEPVGRGISLDPILNLVDLVRNLHLEEDDDIIAGIQA